MKLVFILLCITAHGLTIHDHTNTASGAGGPEKEKQLFRDAIKKESEKTVQFVVETIKEEIKLRLVKQKFEERLERRCDELVFFVREMRYGDRSQDDLPWTQEEIQAINETILRFPEKTFMPSCQILFFEWAKFIKK